jgi:Fe-Mn family superoxide dismutase
MELTRFTLWVTRGIYTSIWFISIYPVLSAANRGFRINATGQSGDQAMPPTRREFLLGASAGLAAATLPPEVFSAPQKPEPTMTPAIPSAFAATHELKPLPFDPAKLDGLSEKLIRSHWENNYGGSVKALNTIKLRLGAALADPDLPAFVYNDMKREHLMRTGSVVLHELYFGNLGNSGKPDNDLRQALGEAFGSFEA